MLKTGKRGQEEMVGFIIIIVIVTVILLFLLVLSLGKGQKQGAESYEVESFIQSALQYTTDCRDYTGYFSVQDLVFECNAGASCLDGRDSCEVMKEVLEELADSGWSVGEDRPVKGYELKVNTQDEELFSLSKGNQTSDSEGGKQSFAKGSESIEILFTAYY